MCLEDRSPHRDDSESKAKTYRGRAMMHYLNQFIYKTKKYLLSWISVFLSLPGKRSWWEMLSRNAWEVSINNEQSNTLIHDYNSLQNWGYIIYPQTDFPEDIWIGKTGSTHRICCKIFHGCTRQNILQLLQGYPN